MRLRRISSSQRPAAATVEFAVLAPLLVFLMVIGVDFARVYYYSMTITNAARSGALYGSDHPENATNTAGIEQTALADTSNLSPAPTVTSTTGNDSAGNPYVRVTVTWSFYTVVDYPGVPSPVVLSRTVQMRVRPASPNNPTSVN